MPRTAAPTISVGIFMEEPKAKEVQNLSIEPSKYKLVVPVTQELFDGMAEALEKDKDHGLSEIILNSVENKTPITFVVENSQMEDDLGGMEVPVGSKDKELAEVASVSFEQKGRGRTNVFRKASQLLGEDDDSLVYAIGEVDEEHLDFASENATVLDAKGNEVFEAEEDEEGDEEEVDEDEEGDEDEAEDGEIDFDDIDFENLEEYETDDLRLIAENLGMDVRPGQRRTTLIPAIEEFIENGGEKEGDEESDEEVDGDTVDAIVEGVTAAIKPLLDKVIKAVQATSSGNGEAPAKRGPGRPKKVAAAPAKRSLRRK